MFPFDDVIMNSLFSALYPDKNPIWLYASDMDRDGVYTNRDTGMALPYENWAAGEPNNFAMENCAQMNTRDGTWSNVRCFGIPGYIICGYDLV